MASVSCFHISQEIRGVLMNSATQLRNAGSGHESKEAHFSELTKLLDALEPNEKKKKDDAFSDAYFSIVKAIARKVPQRVILETLEAGGLKLHPVRFKQRLIEEFKKRNDKGEHLYCQHCNSLLEPVQEKALTTEAFGQGAISSEQKVDA